jgi:heme/copper-type cytochrome/quinol oxidase subunit 2
MESQQNASVMSVKDWVITLLVAAIPLIGFIMLFVWAFGSGNNVNKSNFAKGALILTAILIVIYIIIFMVIGAAFMAGSVGGNN